MRPSRQHTPQATPLPDVPPRPLVRPARPAAVRPPVVTGASLLVITVPPLALDAAPQLLPQRQLGGDGFTRRGVHGCLPALQGTARPLAAVAVLQRQALL